MAWGARMAEATQAQRLAFGHAVLVPALVALSRATGLGILAAATLYGVGKTYLWPTMLGVVAERY